MVQFGEQYANYSLKTILIAFQAGVHSKWTNDSQRFLLKHFDTIQNSPSHIYHSALPLSPSSSWLQKCYGTELSSVVKVIKGLPTEWGVCSRTVLLTSPPWSLSHHNNIIATGSGHGDIIILNAITGSQTGVFSGHTNRILSLMFSSDGTSLVSGSADYTVKLWDIQTGGIVKTFSGHSNWVYSISISADCTRIASGSRDMTIHLWDIQTGECHYTIQQQDEVSLICFSPTNPQLLLSTSAGKIQQWDTNCHQIKPPFDGTYITFSPDGTQFVSCHEGVATVQISDSGATVAELQVVNSDIEHCCFSPDGKLVAGAVSNNICIWDITNPSPHLAETFISHTQSITSLAFSSPSSLISASEDKSVKIWQIDTLSTGPGVTDTNPAPITPIQIQPIALQAIDGITITSDLDGMVKIWDISTGLCKVSYQTPAKGTGCGDAQLIDDRLICVWFTGDRIQVWDTEKGGLWEGDSECSWVNHVKISGDKSKVFTLNHESLKAYSIQTGELLCRVELGGRSYYESLIVNDSRVWMYSPSHGYEEWDFGIPGSLPVQLYNIPPHRLHSSGAILWDIGLYRVEDQATGKVLFQLSRQFIRPVDTQWNEQYLVLYYINGVVLILDFSHLLLQ